MGVVLRFCEAFADMGGLLVSGVGGVAIYLILRWRGDYWRGGGFFLFVVTGGKVCEVRKTTLSL